MNEMMVLNQMNQRASLYEFLCRTKRVLINIIARHIYKFSSRTILSYINSSRLNRGKPKIPLHEKRRNKHAP